MELRVDDLRSPRLTPAQQSVLDYGGTLSVSLDEQELLDEARTRTGLDDFGEGDFRPRLRAQLAAIESDRGLNNLSRLTLRRRMVQLLSSRLGLTELMRLHPEITSIQIDRPLVVVGLPRSGTTHLVNLLAADSRRRALPWWECQEPFPLAGDGPGVDGVDPRYRRCADTYAVESEMMPLTRAMHDRHPQAIEEEVELLDLDFASYVLEWHARVPGWRDHYLALDQREHYAYLRTVLQALTFLRGPRRWVLKSPQHLEQLGPLAETFPDAAFALTHRDPVAVVQSAVTMLAYADRLRRHEIDAPELARYWIDRVEGLLRACVRDRDLLPADRSVDVGFHEFMADDMATVERFYGVAGVEVTARSRRELEAYIAANPRGKHGRLVYDLEGDFGVSPAEVRERFAFYFERFDVRVEH